MRKKKQEKENVFFSMTLCRYNCAKYLNNFNFKIYLFLLKIT